MTVGVLMAGGLGTRMSRSGVEVPKPMVQVDGVALGELALLALLRARVSRVVVSTSAARPQVIAFAEGRLLAVARSCDIPGTVVVEDHAMGNVGALSLVDADDDLLMTFADNLTTLDLADVVTTHQTGSAACTLAVHDEPVAIPYGRVDVVGGAVVGYAEKPDIPVPICSGAAVVGPAAHALITRTRPMGLVDLFRAAQEAGLVVLAHQHAEPWVDVNDGSSLPRARAILAAHPYLRLTGTSQH